MSADGDGAAERRVADFESQRPRLMGICYRILVIDAEDVLQEAWLRWTRVDVDDVDNTEAYLTTVATRLALDRLRRLRAQREVYTGSWLPEPVMNVAGTAGDPAAAAELADSLSMALLVVLQTLSPLERAAFVLHEVFQRPYREIAATLGRQEATVRQLLRRARAKVDAGHSRYRADLATHAAVVQQFMTACQSADLHALLGVLAPDVVIVSDGGGQAPAHPRPVHGQDKVARLLVGIAGRVPDGTVFTVEEFNGAVGLVGRLGGLPISAIAIHTTSAGIDSLHVVANPDKLARFDAGPAAIV